MTGSHSHSFSYHDLLEACTQPGCPICSLSDRSARRYLEALFYEYVNDAGVRDDLLKSRGFCREHAALLLGTRIADSLGASILYEHITRHTLQEVQNLLQSLSAPSFTRNLLKELARRFQHLVRVSQRRGQCPVCKQSQAASERILGDLSQSLEDETLRQALEASDGLCFPHLAQLVKYLPDIDSVRFLLHLTQARLEANRARMSELIRKHDYRFQAEGITLEEAQAWKKAMCMISGANFSTGEGNES